VFDEMLSTGAVITGRRMNPPIRLYRAQGAQ
jgi:hypothetical protein